MCVDVGQARCFHINICVDDVYNMSAPPHHTNIHSRTQTHTPAHARTYIYTPFICFFSLSVSLFSLFPLYLSSFLLFIHRSECIFLEFIYTNVNGYVFGKNLSPFPHLSLPLSLKHTRRKHVKVHLFIIHPCLRHCHKCKFSNKQIPGGNSRTLAHESVCLSR